VAFLKNVKRKIERITTTSSGSLGIHPIVYFYTRGGMFQPSAFLAASLLIDHLIEKNKLKEFARVRRDFEAYLVAHKEIISQVVHKFGSGGRNVTKLVALYLKIIEGLWAGNSDAQIVAQLSADPDFRFLTSAPDPEEDQDDPPKPGGKPRSRTKAAAFQRDALRGGVRCSLCGGYIHKNSMNLDHDKRKREGGPAHGGQPFGEPSLLQLGEGLMEGEKANRCNAKNLRSRIDTCRQKYRTPSHPQLAPPRSRIRKQSLRIG
jgi:hypothetical protein